MPQREVLDRATTPDGKPLTLVREEGHFVVARMEVDYLRPILLGDEVFVGVRTVGIGRSSLRMEHLVTANGESAAKGLGVLVWLEGGRPAPLPEAIRERIRALEGRPL